MQRKSFVFPEAFYPSAERVFQYSVFLKATSIITRTFSVRNLDIPMLIELKIFEKSII
jgi:hypothetical protein